MFSHCQPRQSVTTRGSLSVQEARLGPCQNPWQAPGENICVAEREAFRAALCFNFFFSTANTSSICSEDDKTKVFESFPPVVVSLPCFCVVAVHGQVPELNVILEECQSGVFLLSSCDGGGLSRQTRLRNDQKVGRVQIPLSRSKAFDPKLLPTAWAASVWRRWCVNV